MRSNHQVLARKYRPRNFQTLIGQEATVRMLTHSLTEQRLHHAYLLTGTRGVGKTTTGRIFAKCLNCEKGITPTPCDECDTCKAIDAGRFVDLIEIDAASRTKVEDTRELLENVQYVPTQGRFKIYLIDEVHMLSGHSFNALLKTLEEPPAHVKFMLATTDPKKLPITILSRCLQFHLRHVSAEQLALHLKTLCEAEKISFELDALKRIAAAADGSVRDALSILDQAITFCRDTITDDETRQMLGQVEQTRLFELLAALASREAPAVYQEIQTLKEQGLDGFQVLTELQSLLHQMTLSQVVPTATADERIKELAKQFSPEEVQLYYQIALIGKRDLPYAPNPALGLEMVILRMLAFKPADASEPLAPSTAETTQPKPLVKTESPQPTQWGELLPLLQLKGVAYALAANCSQTSYQDNKITLALSSQHQALLNNKVTERIQEALTQYFKKPMQLTIQLVDEPLQTPIKEHQEKMAIKQDKATATIKEDAHVKSLLSEFNATLDPHSIRAVEEDA